MDRHFQAIRRRQVQRIIDLFIPAMEIPLPKHGWLRTVRQSLGITQREMAKKLGVSLSSFIRMENSEGQGRITIKMIRRVAEAMGCMLTYAIVPVCGSLERMVENRAKEKAATLIRSVDNNMALEGQKVPGTEERIKRETKTILDK